MEKKKELLRRLINSIVILNTSDIEKSYQTDIINLMAELFLFVQEKENLPGV